LFLKITKNSGQRLRCQFRQLTRDEQTLLFASRTLVKKGTANHTTGDIPPLPGKKRVTPVAVYFQRNRRIKGKIPNTPQIRL
jgi:hypothetical protein